MEELLVKAGLSITQARLYIYLLGEEQSTPPAMARNLGLTRTNAYKILGQLEELDLVQKVRIHKRVTYQAADPAALASLVAIQRNHALSTEHTVNEAIQQLRVLHRKSDQVTKITIGRGANALIDAYEMQAEQRQTIHYIRSRADIPFLGFEAMHRIRMLPARAGIRRFGITPDALEAPVNPVSDEKSNLTRTKIPIDRYTALVEWTITEEELLILVFEGEGHYIRICDKTVAQAFQQIWQLANHTSKL